MSDSRDIVDSGTPGLTFGDLLLLLKRNVELDLRVSAPATVVAYDPTAQKATLTLGFIPVASNDDGTEVPEVPLTLYNVPVRWPRTNSGYITFPLNPNDTGHVVFTDRCLTQWLNVGSAVDPIQGRTHSMGDAIFEPGLHSDSSPISPATDLTATVIEGDTIKLGRNATDAVNRVALAEALHSYLSALFATGVPIGGPGGDGGAALQTAWTAYLVANPFTDFATTKTIAE